jgi:hypothetical protein
MAGASSARIAVGPEDALSSQVVEQFLAQEGLTELEQ